MNNLRTIHPVGHGAFYSEVINNDDIVIYDCGSRSSKNVIKCINNLRTAVPNGTIQGLFVSHYDKDHINGIHELFVRMGVAKRVFVPWLDYDFALLEFGMILATGLKKSLYSFAFSLMVSHDMQGVEIERISPDAPTSLSDGLIQLPNPLWEYIPVVYVDTANRVNANKYQNDLLVAFCAKDVKELIERIPSDFDKAKVIFERSNFKIDRNSISLMLYSGAVKKSNNNTLVSIPNKTYISTKGTLKVSLAKSISSALYLGDIPLNSFVLGRISAVLGPQREKKICLLQMPHHGATFNHDSSYVTKYGSSKIFFCCVKSKDKKHPGNIPMIDILSDRKYLCIIDETENPLTESIDF